MLAWRDLDDPEAGGSEVHAAQRRRALGRGRHRGHDAHVVRRRATRPADRARRLPGDPQGRPLPGVPPSAAFSEMMGRHGGRDGLVEIWNGMPFFSPLWAARPAGRLAAPRARRRCGR